MMDDGWHAKALPPAAREAKHQAMRSLTADRWLLRRSAMVVAGGLACAGIVALTASAVGWLALMPLKTIEYRLISVDQTTGIIGVPVSLKDAPTLFSEATDHQYLKRYIGACDGYVPDMDTNNNRLCKLMSAPDEQVRIEARRARPESAVMRLGKEGHIEIETFRAHRRPDGANLTRSYFVQFVAAEWSRGSATRTPYSGTIDFQWHPELPMTPADRDDNTGGFQALAHSVSQDTPDRRMR